MATPASGLTCRAGHRSTDGIPSLDEGTYRYAAYSTDGTDYSAYTLRYGFTVDPSPPSVPKVLEALIEALIMQLGLPRSDIVGQTGSRIAPTYPGDGAGRAVRATRRGADGA